MSLAQAGIKTCAYFVIGHPGETEDDFQQTLEFLTELKDYFWQAEPNAFYYIYDGQANNDLWAKKRRFLYSSKYFDSLIFRTWTLDLEPSREEIYERAARFSNHCQKIGIPNPYSLKEIKEADDRWKALHINAVPAMTDFADNRVTCEEKSKIEAYASVTYQETENLEFDFT
jgi:radical SAM superfamily enzyme YgiQ (UPF0313 family)